MSAISQRYNNYQTSSIMKIRCYSKQDFSLLYFSDSDPRTATCHLMRWINRIPQLCKDL